MGWELSLSCWASSPDRCFRMHKNLAFGGRLTRSAKRMPNSKMLCSLCVCTDQEPGMAADPVLGTEVDETAAAVLRELTPHP